MIALCLVAIITVTDAASVLFKDNPYFVDPCKEGAIVENNCNRCICSPSHTFQCLTKNSSNCKEDGSLLESCQPNIMYELNDIVCICNNSGQWPHAQCKKVFRSLDHPTENNCNPDTYFKSDCNVCKCGPDGKIDKARCTKNKCTGKAENNVLSRRIANNVYGNCEIKNWYSLAPCQFCFCVNENKLVCNTGNAYAHKLELGAYNLSVCGKELIREAVELIPENVLRHGTENISIKPQAAKVKEITLNQNSVAVDVNREESNLNKDNQNYINEENNLDNNEEYYTDSEEVKPPTRIGREEQSIPIHFDNESPNERKEYEQDIDTEEMGVEIEPPVHEKVVKEIEVTVPSYQPLEIVNKLPDDFNLGEALKLNLPMVLDKVFQMALRKSMVSVDSDSKCTPGAATILKCNVCFCMKENKLLCTNNVCP